MLFVHTLFFAVMISAVVGVVAVVVDDIVVVGIVTGADVSVVVAQIVCTKC